MTILTGIAGLCLAIGLLFNALGIIGILRFPDVYTRLHADTKATTFGSIFTTLSVIVFSLGLYATGEGGENLVLALHAFVAIVVLGLTNAVGAHAIARAAHRGGVKPSPAVVDQFREGSA